MFASLSPASFPFASVASADTSRTVTDPWTGERYRPSGSLTFVTLIRGHHRSIFHLVHALLRDEVAAEKITQQVFARARRRLERGSNSDAVVEWIYYASLRFVRMHHRRTAGALARRRNAATIHNLGGLDLHTFVRVIVRHPGKLDPRDCELIALRHVIGLSLANIGQLLRLHPYEVANRLAWAEERLAKLDGAAAVSSAPPFRRNASESGLAMSA